jgi:transcriptional regulator with XRE-family HTH domain
LLELTQREVAANCGLTFQQIQKYEAGQVAIPLARMVTLAGVLRAPLSAFVDDGAEAAWVAA